MQKLVVLISPLEFCVHTIEIKAHLLLGFPSDGRWMDCDRGVRRHGLGKSGRAILAEISVSEIH
jgi:hypothetical protein